MSKISSKMLDNIPANMVVETIDRKFIAPADMTKIEQALLISGTTHDHTNLATLDGLTDSGTGTLKYNGTDVAISDASEIIVADVDNLFSSETKSVENILRELMVGLIGGELGVPKLKEVTHTDMLLAGTSKEVHLDVGFSKYDIRTVYFGSTGLITLKIKDQATGGFTVYQSLNAVNAYDIVNAPCEDKDTTDKIHVTIENNGTGTVNLDLSIKLTSLA